MTSGCDACDLDWKRQHYLRCSDCVQLYGVLGMAECQTCRGSRYVWRRDEFSSGIYPCPQCNGHAIESCCDGEDRWQIEKLDSEGHPPVKHATDCRCPICLGMLPSKL